MNRNFERRAGMRLMEKVAQEWEERELEWREKDHESLERQVDEGGVVDEGFRPSVGPSFPGGRAIVVSSWRLALATILAMGMVQSVLAQGRPGTLQLTILDAESAEPVPARVEIVSEDGTYHVAEDAVRIGGDCDMSDDGAGYTDLASALAGFQDRLENPYTRSTQFYSDGRSRIQLPAGTATVRVFKGPEYEQPAAEVRIRAGETLEHQIRVQRWIDMPARGWYSADDHLHIQRPHPDLDALISKMMQAEDIHVGNLLQMGKVRNFTIAPQHAHGREGHYQTGHFILAAGQENPRTHFLGHTITLGAEEPLHDPKKYLIYRLIWEQAVQQGGINGFAHAYFPNGSALRPHDGMAVVLPHNLLHFVEVLQFNRSGYEAWYDILALGFRVTPTAGTDYPCAGQTIPGHERFYTKVEGAWTYESWLEGVRAGRTFVTTGPLIDFQINGQDIGSEIVLEAPGTVTIEGSADFDPERDAPHFLELVRNGRVIGRFSRIGEARRIEFSTTVRVDEASWFALRGYGDRPADRWPDVSYQFVPFGPPSNVHSAPIYVSLKDGPGIERSAASSKVARTWLARLDDLERVLSAENLEELARRLESPNYDAVPREVLFENRVDLLAEIRTAQEFFRKLAE